MPEDQYVKMLSGNPIYLSVNSLLRDEMKEVQKEIDIDMPEEQLVQWKKEYRRTDKKTV